MQQMKQNRPHVNELDKGGWAETWVHWMLFYTDFHNKNLKVYDN